MNCTTQIEGARGTLRLEGRFTFEASAGFKAQAEALLDAGSVSELLLDFSAVTLLEPSALGVLLLLREEAELNGSRIVVKGPSPALGAIFDAVNFGQLFEIRP